MAAILFIKRTIRLLRLTIKQKIVENWTTERIRYDQLFYKPIVTKCQKIIIFTRIKMNDFTKLMDS